MVRNKDEVFELRSISSFDARQDIRRCRAVWPTQFDFHNSLCEERNIIEEDDGIEKGYKNLLFCLLSRDEMSESQNEERDEDDEDDCCSEISDPECRLLLQHLRPRGELSVLEYEKERMLMVSQYGDMYSDEEFECNLESYGEELDGTAEHGKLIGQKRGRGRPRKLKNHSENIPLSSSVNKTKKRRKTRNDDRTVWRRFTRSMTSNIGGKNRRKNIPLSKKTDTCRKSRNETNSDEAEVVRISLEEYLYLHQNVNLEDDDHHFNVHNEKIYEVNDRTEHKRRKLSIVTTMRKSKNKNDKVERDDVGPTPFKNGSSSMRKSRTVSQKNVEVVKCSYRDFMIAKNSREKEQKREKCRKSSEAPKQTPRVENQRKRGRGRPRKTFQTGTTSAVRKSRNVTEEIKIEKCSANESMNAKARDRINEINVRKEVEDESIPEDLPACFVPSKRFHRDIVDDNPKQRGGSSVCNEFRKQVLSVLGKPFDKDEYRRRTEAVKDGNYLVYYSDLKKKLCKYQYKRAKRMTILRGFFFWLQNVTQEGAFKPWKDRECLDVVPGSPVEPSTRN